MYLGGTSHTPYAPLITQQFSTAITRTSCTVIVPQIPELASYALIIWSPSVELRCLPLDVTNAQAKGTGVPRIQASVILTRHENQSNSMGVFGPNARQTISTVAVILLT